MPILFVTATIAGAAAVGAAAVAGTAITLATFLVPAAIAGIGGFILQKLAPRVDPQGLNVTGASARTVRSAITPARWILGRARVGGVLVWIEEPAADQNRLRAIYVISEAPVDAIEDVWINGQRAGIVWTGDAHSNLGATGTPSRSRYDVRSTAGLEAFRITARLSGAAFHPYATTLGDLTPRPWTSEHQLQGLAWVLVTFIQHPWQPDPDQRVWSGLPELQFLVRGQRISWPGQATPTWTQNAAAIRYWWLTQRRGVAASEIDRARFDAAFALCESELVLSGLAGFSDDFPNGVPRYSINGVVTAGERPEVIEAEMDAAWAGHVVEFDGIHRFLPGAERAPTVTLGADDIIAAPVFRPAPEQHERVNRLTARLAQSYLHDWTAYSLPAIDDVEAQTRDGERLASDLGELRFVVDPVVGLNILTIELRRERAAALLDLVVRPGDGFQNLAVAPGDTALVTIPEWSLESQRYLVLSSSVDADWSVRLSLVESPVGIYTDTLILPMLSRLPFAPPAPPIPDPDPVDPSLAAPTGLSVVTEPETNLGLSFEWGAGAKLEIGTFSWSAVADATGYEYQFRTADIATPSADLWRTVARRELTQRLWLTEHGGDFSSVEDWRWWVRAIGSQGARSAATSGGIVAVRQSFPIPTISIASVSNVTNGRMFVIHVDDNVQIPSGGLSTPFVALADDEQQAFDFTSSDGFADFTERIWRYNIIVADGDQISLNVWFRVRVSGIDIGATPTASIQLPPA